MWKCFKCGRIFEKSNQPHTCRKIPLENHFKNKQKAEELFNVLLKKINKSIGKAEVVSIPCCIHLFGKYDFLAVLPKKDRMEIRFGLDRRLDSKRLKIAVSVSSKYFKNCIDIKERKEIDGEILSWVKEAYFLKDRSILISTTGRT